MITCRLCSVIFICSVFLSVLADELPPGVPNPIGSDGKYTPAIRFTTKAYQLEACRLMLQEANVIAAQLRLDENLPITETNHAKFFVCPFGYGYVKKAIGSITTQKYAYYFSHDYKFSYLDAKDQDGDAQKYQASYTWPINLINTNEPYQLATQWLAAISVDLRALNHDCSLKVDLDNGYVNPPAGTFVPIYYVSWSDSRNKEVASIRVLTPTKTLMQLRVEDPKYILREPIVFTNLAYLLSQTNNAGEAKHGNSDKN
jgi:hypothetical protein